MSEKPLTVVKDCFMSVHGELIRACFLAGGNPISMAGGIDRPPDSFRCRLSGLILRLDEPSPGLLINTICHDHTQLIQRFENAD